ncbi:MAG: carboxypeptidase regulatory-like domain-containing protein, partial [Blastocatellia bacterium]
MRRRFYAALLLFSLLLTTGPALLSQTGGARTAGARAKRQSARRAGETKQGVAKQNTANQSTVWALRQPDIAAILAGAALATADFDLIGLAVRVDPATQTVPKNTPTGILTSLQLPEGADPGPILASLNPNYRIRGDLSGPSFTGPRIVEAKIGDPLLIPPMNQAGDHAVRNLRVIDTGLPGSPVIAPVTPDACGIHVLEQILVSQVAVRELTFDQIVQSGIRITDDSYQFFNFSLALSTTSSTQQINIPVAFPQLTNTPAPPVVGAPRVASIGLAAPDLKMPDVLPVMLEGINLPSGSEGLTLDNEPIRIPGVIVFPGRVGLLNQFFEAVVIVANGAPNGAPLVIRGLRAKMRLPDNGTPGNPSDDPLRVAETQTGGAVTDLEIHDLGPDGLYGTGDDIARFTPGQKGQATFLIEGLREGMHQINFDLEGTLEGLPIGPVTVRGQVSGAVVVRDASFAVSFTHPDVVRAGNEYELAMTVYNTGGRAINGAVAQLGAASISGAQLAASGDDGRRAFRATINKGESATIIWRMRANTTGQVTAAYTKAGDGIEAGLNLVTGVGDRNIPLSPDSLILPDQVRFLPAPVVTAARNLLGQAWSVANAPPAALPTGVKAIGKSVVYARAVELGVAGLRVDFGEPVSVSLQTMLRDWLGELQTTPDAGFADAMRNTFSGYAWHDSIGAYLHERMTAATPLTATALHRELADAEAPRSALVSAMVTQANGPALFGARLVDPAGNRAGSGAAPGQRSGDLANAAALSLTNGNNTAGQLLLASQPANGNWWLELHAWQTGAIDISLLTPVSGHNYRQVSFNGLAINAGARYRLLFNPAIAGPVTIEEFRDNAWIAKPATPVTTALNESAPRVTGVVQIAPETLSGGDRYGRLVGVLFNKPVTSGAQNAARYQVGPGALAGSSPAQSIGGVIGVNGASLNFGNRIAMLALNAPVGPFIRRDLTVNGVTDERGQPLAGNTVTAPINARVSPLGNPPGAYLSGRVLLADGTPVVNAPLYYRQPLCTGSNAGLTSIASGGSGVITGQNTDAQGRYTVDYVVDGDCGTAIYTALNPATSSQKEFSTPVRFHGQQMILDFVFLARGKAQGTVTSAGVPVANATVQVIPALDANGSKVIKTDATGKYFVEDIPVGNLSVKAVGSGALSLATGLAAGAILAPGQTATINVALQNVSGIVRGQVRRDSNAPAPGSLVIASADIPEFGSGITVGYAYTDRDGNFTLTGLPVGPVRLRLTDYVTGLVVEQTVQLTTATPEVSGVVLTLPGQGSVSGRVVDETGAPLPLARVVAAGAGVLADVQGNYTLTSLNAGAISVTAQDPATFASGSITISLAAGQTVTGATIVINRPSTIRGVVSQTNSDGGVTPIASAFVSHDGFTRVTTDALGRYTLGNVTSNRSYTLRFVHPAGKLAVNLPVVVGAAETITRNATFAKPATLRGKVFQPDGINAAVARVALSVTRPSLDTNQYFGLLGTGQAIYTQTSTAGLYAITGVNPGTYSVTASNDFFPIPVSKGGTLAAGGDEQCDLTLVSTLAGKIQGRIYRPDGVTPVAAGVNVTLGGGALADVTVRTSDTGQYEFAQVFSQGNYRLTATDPNTGETNRSYISVRANQDTIADLRLLGYGGLRLRVLDGAGNPVNTGGADITGAAYPNIKRVVELTAGGVVQFDNLPEGEYAVCAASGGFSGRNSMTVVRGAVGEVTIRLQASGSIAGRVLMPDGTTPVGLADVRLIQNGRTFGFVVSNDFEGQIGAFRFDNVPTGEFTVEAFDNRSGRTGRGAGRINTQGETANVDVTLVPVGNVLGRVTANGAPVDHALVTITSSGIRPITLNATTGPDGRYRFTGIPAGNVSLRVTNAPGGQTGNASGVVPSGAEPLPDTAIDIALAPSFTLAGTITRLNGVDPVNGALVKITAGGRNFQTTANASGQYRMEFLPLGNVLVRAEAPAGFDRGEAAVVSVTEAGSTQNINVTLAGVGAVTGAALDSNGAALPAGTVTLTATVNGSTLTFTAAVQPNGRYEISGVPAGSFTLKLSVPNRTGGGTAAGAITANQPLELPIRLEDAGTVTGLVRAPNGTSPAVGADVTLRLSRNGANIATYFTHTNTQGAFSVENIPLGTVTVSVFDPANNGVAYGSATLTTNGQTADTGTLTLDNTPIRVLAVAPSDGVTNVARNTAVTMTLSEPALASTVNTSTVRLLNGVNAVSAAVTLSTDGRTITLTPSARLADVTLYTVVVSTSLKDLAQLALAAEFRSRFTTADETAPLVDGFSPVHNATQVALNALILATFDETLDRNQNLSQVMRLFTGPAQDQPVAGVVSLDDTARILTFTPAATLTESTRYTISVNGQKDASGNAQTTAATASFTTRDLTPPVIDPLAIDGLRVQTFAPAITAAYRDNLSGVNPLSAVLTLDGVNVTATATVGATSLSFTPATPLARGPHTVTLQISDNAGNASLTRTAAFTIDDSAPIITAFTIAGVNAADGLTVTTTLRPVFAATYSDDSISLTGTKLLLGPQGGVLMDVTATVTNTNLTYQPAVNLAEGAYTAQLLVTDTLGNQASRTVSFTIDADAPDILSVSPGAGGQHGGTVVTITGNRLLNSTGTAPLVNVAGWPATVKSLTAGAPDQVVIVTPASVPGVASVEVRTDRGAGLAPGAFTYQADPKTPFAAEADTLLLWRLDEPANGAARIVGDARTAYSGAAVSVSTATQGRFGGGRINAGITADGDAGGLSFPNTSFTSETWFKTTPVGRSYYLLGKHDNAGGALEYGLRLTPAGGIEAHLR